ncbi:hypothetical protein niasHS_018012 [Heterodera schachtii]|uniref:Ubiquitin-like domain-containing protein n=1 Tax=Heterodera schachtii TaxID=97005 RepID=A0ABD2HUZ8_HETSC
MNQFCFVGICAGLAMLMLMIMPSSIADDKLEINVKGEKEAIVYVKKTDTVLKVKEKIVENLKENINEEIDIIKEKLSEANAKETEIIKEKKTHKLKETLKVNVNEETKILEAKLVEKNNEKNKIVPERITLRLQKNGPPLEDGKPMKECGIKTDDYGINYVYVYLTWDEFKIKVEDDKNVKNVIVYAKKTDKVSTLKQTIVEKLTKNINEEIYIIKTKLSKANAKETDFITVIKEKIFGNKIDELKVELEEKKKETNKILTARKILRLDKNGSPPFEDGKTISEYVKNGAIVFLALEGFEIFVDYKGKTYTVWVNDEDTVVELKEKIQKVIGIDETKRIWTLKSHEDVLKDCTKTMLFHNIGKGTLLSLKRQFQIGCQYYNDKDYLQNVEETEKVSSVKEKVKDMIQEKIGILLNNIKLSCWGIELKDDAEIGSYDGIDYESATVHVWSSNGSRF